MLRVDDTPQQPHTFEVSAELQPFANRRLTQRAASQAQPKAAIIGRLVSLVSAWLVGKKGAYISRPLSVALAALSRRRNTSSEWKKSKVKTTAHK